MEWTKVCKEKIKKEIRNKLQGQSNRTKMKILGKEKWERKEYIEEGNGVIIQKIIRVKTEHDQPKKES